MVWGMSVGFSLSRTARIRVAGLTRLQLDEVGRERQVQRQGMLRRAV